MAQNTNVEVPSIRYTRADFTALRAKLNKIPTRNIMTLYYSEGELYAMDCETPERLDKRLEDMRDHLVQRVSLSQPHIAKHLVDARRFNNWSKAAVDYLVNAADKDMSQAVLTDAISVWFKPTVASVLKEERIQSLGQLKQWIEAKGEGWYRPIPRIGALKAKAIERWFMRQPKLGGLRIAKDNVQAGQVIIGSALTGPVPLDRISGVAAELSGSTGRNRNESFPLISARNDLDAVRAYLYKFRGQDKTLRSYKKELERFLLWCVLERKIAMSSMLTDDCEAYKDFLANVPQKWIGSWAPRHSERWRPFSGQLQPQSQRYAIQVIRTFFEWLMKVRYLGGNPWVTVADPRMAAKELSMDIDKALPEALWNHVAGQDGLLDVVCSRYPATNTGPYAPKSPDVIGAQYRLARAAIVLMGNSGLRREEVAFATRNRLKALPESPDVWELAVLGKREKWRTVFIPVRAVNLMREHWRDRGHDFDAPSEMALISPVAIAPTATSKTKHLTGPDASSLSGAGFSPDGLYQVVKTALLRMAEDESLALDTWQRDFLKSSAPHALRHTFATHAATSMPQDVLQRLLGHASANTTAIYVRAERTRSISESLKFFSR